MHEEVELQKRPLTFWACLNWSRLCVSRSQTSHLSWPSHKRSIYINPMFGVQENNHKKKKKKNKKPLELVFLFSEVGCMISMKCMGYDFNESHWLGTDGWGPTYHQSSTEKSQGFPIHFSVSVSQFPDYHERR